MDAHALPGGHAATNGSGAVGPLLARTRRARRISQLDLAGEAGVSARHLSFVETGRAQPSREMVLRLCEALHVPPREADAFLLAAGFAPAHRETPLEAPAMGDVLEALRLMLGRHDPLPAAAFDGRWDVVMANEGFATWVDGCLTAGADVAAGRGPIPRLTLIEAPRPNLLRLVCHPDGARRSVANWPEVTREFLHRVAGEMRVMPPPPERRPPLEEALSYPGVKSLLRGGPDGYGLLLPVEFRNPDGSTQRLISTLATLGSAQDLTLRELRIEMYHLA